MSIWREQWLELEKVEAVLRASTCSFRKMRSYYSTYTKSSPVKTSGILLSGILF